MKSFGKGFFTGIVTTVGVVAGAVYAFKKTVVETNEKNVKPILEEHRRRALRKSRSAHQR